MKGKMALIGDGDSVMIFRAGGVDTYNACDINESQNILKKIKDDYQIIFITDNFSIGMQEYISEINTSAYPIIITVPSKNGNNGYGMENIKKEMEKSLGIDILFNND